MNLSMQENNTSIPQSKCAVIGEQKVGKTSLVSRLAPGLFPSSYVPTLGVDFAIKTVDVNEEWIKIQFWDMSGAPQFRQINGQMLRSIDCCLLVYDITARSSFLALEDFMLLLSEKVSREDYGILLIGTNKDREEERQVSKEEAQAWCQAQGRLITFFEVSAKNDEELSWWLSFEIAKLCHRKEDASKVERRISITPRVHEPPLRTCCGGGSTNARRTSTAAAQGNVQVVNLLLETLKTRLKEVQKKEDVVEVKIDQADCEDDQRKACVKEFSTVQQSIWEMQQALEAKNADAERLKNQMAMLENKITSMQKDVDQMPLIQEEQKQQKEKLEVHHTALEKAGVFARAELEKEIEGLQETDSNLYNYFKTFYWTTTNLFGAYRALSTGLVQGHTDVAISPQNRAKMLQDGAKKAVQYGASLLKGVPLVGTAMTGLEKIISYVSGHTFENNVNSINKIIQAKFGLEDNISLNIARLALTMTKTRRKVILYPEMNSLEAQEGLSARLKQGAKWLKQQVNSVKDSILPKIDLHDLNDKAASLALEDVSLLIAYLCKYPEKISQSKIQLDVKCAEIVEFGVLDNFVATIKTEEEQQPQQGGCCTCVKNIFRSKSRAVKSDGDGDLYERLI